jgi:TetR/AcrR family transcriptional regulator, cholesterol catabolism regulator
MAKVATTIKDQELVAQRRAEIVDVATRLFLERGFHKTSIRDIARACPFNLASLYTYVASKEDILFLVAQHVIEEKASAMAAIETIDGDPAESLRIALRAYCLIVHRYRAHIRLLYRELDVLSPERRELVMASLSTVEGLGHAPHHDRLISNHAIAGTARESGPVNANDAAAVHQQNQ